MTSFYGTAIKKHFAATGVKLSTEVLAAQRFGYLRIATESRPFAKDTLKLRNGKGMKRDFCYVNVKQSYVTELQALAQYGFKKSVDGIDAYRLTSQATKNLINAVRSKEKSKEKNMKGRRANSNTRLKE
jgi:hypothetical protein